MATEGCAVERSENTQGGQVTWEIRSAFYLTKRKEYAC